MERVKEEIDLALSQLKESNYELAAWHFTLAAAHCLPEGERRDFMFAVGQFDPDWFNDGLDEVESAYYARLFADAIAWLLRPAQPELEGTPDNAPKLELVS